MKWNDIRFENLDEMKLSWNKIWDEKMRWDEKRLVEMQSGTRWNEMRINLRRA